MVLSKPYLFIAGPPDVFGMAGEGLTHPYNLAPADGLQKQEESLAGKMGASLIVVNREDGKQLKELKLDAPPVWDGMVGIERKLFIAGTDGRIVCIETAGESK